MIDQSLRQAVEHHQTGRVIEAEQIYRQILQVSPNHTDALNLLGVICSQRKEYESACELIARAIRLSPRNPSYHRNLGTAYHDRGMAEQAIANWQTAIRLKPNWPDLLRTLGSAQVEAGRLDDAIANFQRAIALDPRQAESHYALGRMLDDKKQFTQAVDCYRKALQLRPAYPEACNALAHNAKADGDLDQAIAWYRRAIEINPDYVVAWNNWLLALLYHPATTPLSFAADLRSWNERFAQPLVRFIQPHLNDRDPNRRLRIGYVSPDFRSHPVGRLFIQNLLAFRNHDSFEVYSYAEVEKPDAMTAGFQGLSDYWRNTAGMSDEQLDQQIRADRIDILIDLALHSANNRLLVFARKPAPVQFSFGGYPASTGLATIDYRLTDAYLDPPGIADAHYTETLIRLPETFWCDASIPEEPVPATLPAYANGFVTFGCLNNPCKLNALTFDAWTRILNQVPNSRIILLGPTTAAQERAIAGLHSRGIAIDRIDSVGMQTVQAYRETYHRIDIALDAWPFNGHTTSVDAMWMGVPVVTWVGPTAVGRMGVSLLNNLKLPNLIGRSAQDYVQIAVELASDLPRLDELRRTLRDRMRNAPLMDARGFVRAVETAYRQAWVEGSAKCKVQSAE